MILTAKYSFYLGPPGDLHVIKKGEPFQPKATRYMSADENADSFIRQCAARPATKAEIADYNGGRG